jgi:hypothetical protein
MAGRSDGAFRELLVGHVAHQARGRPSRRMDLVHYGLHADFVNVGDENRGTVGGEHARDRAPDPRTSPGDDRGTSPYVVCSHVPRPQFRSASARQLPDHDPKVRLPRGAGIGRSAFP